MDRRTGIILAWDSSELTVNDKELLQVIAPYIDYVKVGLEAMTAENPDGQTVAWRVREFVHHVLRKDVMWDMKLHDIGNTVIKAVKNIMQYRSGMFTLHATCSDETLRAVAKLTMTDGEVSLCHPLAVTVLTDLDSDQCKSRFGDYPNEAVRHFAENAKSCGVTGMVCSPKELSYLGLYKTLQGMTTVIPGIRPVWAAVGDQKRVMTPGEAAKAGADYIVVGRPILQPPAEIGGPVEAAKRIRAELDEALA